jgi:hypothetical protein
MKQYVVDLTPEERSQLDQLSKDSKASAQRRRQAQILLAVDEAAEGPGFSDAAVAKAFRCWPRTVERLRKRFVEEGFESCLEHGNRGAARPKTFDGQAEAHLIALGCSQPPAGRTRWTLQLLADRVVELGVVESCCATTVFNTLKKTSFSLTDTNNGASHQMPTPNL